MSNGDKFYTEQMITDLKLEGVFELLLSDEYVFRGQGDYSWDLTTTFERKTQGIKSDNRRSLEKKIIMEFKRRAHHHISNLPQSEVEWLALMRHYGSPSRLLDFTYSFAVALYFAVEDTDKDSAVWAIRTSYLIQRPEPASKDHVLPTYCKEAEDEAEKIINANDAKVPQKPGVILVEPFRQSQRLALQKGVFAFPLSIEDSFENNLRERLRKYHYDPSQTSDQPLPTYIVYKIKIPQKCHNEIIRFLDKLNINGATLFPDLEGHAKSQITYIKTAQQYEDVMRRLREDIMNQLLKPTD